MYDPFASFKNGPNIPSYFDLQEAFGIILSTEGALQGGGKCKT